MAQPVYQYPPSAPQQPGYAYPPPPQQAGYAPQQQAYGGYGQNYPQMPQGVTPYPMPVVLPPPATSTWGMGMDSFINQSVEARIHTSKHDTCVISSAHRRYQINPKFAAYLQKISTYSTVRLCSMILSSWPAASSPPHNQQVLLLDDSGSMRDLADPDTGNPMTRWEELKMTVSEMYRFPARFTPRENGGRSFVDAQVNIVIEAHAAVGVPCDIYFINRGAYRNVTAYSQLAEAFMSPPHGQTNLVHALMQISNDLMDPDMMIRWGWWT